MTLPAPLREHLGAESLCALWRVVRERLEGSGHVVRGAVTVTLDEEGADRLAGLLGRAIRPGQVRVRLVELDTALRASSARRGLTAAVAALTGSPLRDRPAERATRELAWREVWAELDEQLVRAGLAQSEWAARWVGWLHASGVVTRLGIDRARATLRAVAAVLAELSPALGGHPGTVGLGALASRTTGSAHGLDEGRTAAALVLRAASFAFDAPPPGSSAERRQLWQRLGVETDLISGTVLVWALRPPGADTWSQMMNERADLGLVTHLTMRELRDHRGPFTADGAVVHGCENPQVLQALADAGVRSPLLCVSGNPSAAAMVLISAVRLRYHGDFDWPGVDIARRLITAGAEPWRMGAADYREALAAVPVDARLALTGRPQPTPWEPDLAAAMTAQGVAVHEESVVPALLRDLR